MPLTPSQRVTLMREIASRLYEESLTLIDVTLVQFGLPTSDEWNGNWYGYVLKMIEKASDSVLVDLAQHVGYEVAFAEALRVESAILVEAPFWKKRMFRLFLSHLAVHKKYASKLQQELLTCYISCFVAHSDIEPTLEWQTEIETALASCDGLVALLHEGFHASNWTDQEIGFVMGRRVPAFAVRLGETPYGFIGRFQAFNGNDKSPLTLANEIFTTFLTNRHTQQKMAEVIVKAFENSDSYSETLRVIEYVELLEVWQQSFSGRIQNAAILNSQVEGAYGVPRRVEKLIQKWKGKV
jgi:hypothetical protein